MRATEEDAMRYNLRAATIIVSVLAGPTFACAEDAATTGQAAKAQAAPADAAGAGPREATPQTMPSKFSAENAAKDKIPLAVQPFELTAAQKQAILRSIGGGKGAPAATASGPQIEPQPGAVLADGYELQDLPADVVAQAPGLRGYKLVAAGERAFIVSPDNRIVEAE